MDQQEAKRRERIFNYRCHDTYELDVIRTESQEIHIPQLLPSEPPDGIIYKFGPSGYITKNKNDSFCLIQIEWFNPNNYYHWTFSELPLMYLALESSANNIVFPDVLLEANFTFQVRWLEILRELFPNKAILKLSKNSDKLSGMVPINHDTSTNMSKIGNCHYRHYHGGRATPYCLEIMNNVKAHIAKNNYYNGAKIYINRANRRLSNEDEIQLYLSKCGFAILYLENLTLDEQINMFAHASVIIGMHGAGLANMVFCSEDVNIIEIVDKDFVHPSYVDGVSIPGIKATRTYFHMVGHMKKLNYHVLESNNYFLSIEKLAAKIDSFQIVI